MISGRTRFLHLKRPHRCNSHAGGLVTGRATCKVENFQFGMTQALSLNVGAQSTLQVGMMVQYLTWVLPARTSHIAKVALTRVTRDWRWCRS